MKYTLLQMTQDILSSMSSDEINSISDTPESLQVATIIKQKYFDIINRTDMPNNDQLIQLTPSGNSIIPTLMYIPDGVSAIKWIKYFDANSLDGNTADDFAHDLNTDISGGVSGGSSWTTTSSTSQTLGTGLFTFTVSAGLKITVGDNAVAYTSNDYSMSGTVTSYSGTTLVLNITSFSGNGTYSSWTIKQGTTVPYGPGYLYVQMLSNDDFIDMVTAFNPSDSNVLSYQFADNSNNFNGNFTWYYKNDSQPTYCTILSNYYVLFDSYDSSLDTTLQGSKTMALGTVIPAFTVADTFIPDLPEDQFQLLVNEAKSLAWMELKQQPHPLAIKEVDRNWSIIQKKKSIVNRPTYFDELPGFGRKRGYYGFRGNWTTGFNNERGGLY